MARTEILVKVVEGDALTYPTDVLVLKHAQGIFGLDAAVVLRLKSAGRLVRLPDLGKASFEDAVAGIAAQKLLFVGVPGPSELVYGDIRRFACRALISIGQEFPRTKHVMFTIHGAGFGLDEVEAFRAEIAGIAEAIRAGQYPMELEGVTIIENNRGRVRRLHSTLLELLKHGTIKTGAAGPLEDASTGDELRSAGYTSETKPKVFVAMPFKEDMDDTYHYGIQSAVNAAGYLCERADLSSFTGDVLEFVKSRIRSASLVVADLTEANPNVYLEVGYAWGVGVPTVLLVRKTDEVKFDVRGQRRLAYGRIRELEELLTTELRSLPKRN